MVIFFIWALIICFDDSNDHFYVNTFYQCLLLEMFTLSGLNVLNTTMPRVRVLNWINRRGSN